MFLKMKKQFNLCLLSVCMLVLGAVLQVVANECGTINIPKGLSIEELNQNRPFAVAIYEIKESRTVCGGTLISKKHVLTGIYEINVLKFS